MTPLRITVASDPLDFAIWPRLDEPGEGAAYIFQTAEMLGIWRRTIGAARRVLPLFACIESASGEPLMLLALGIERRAGGTRVLTFLDGGVSDYNAPILFPGGQQLRTRQPTGLWRAIAESLPSFDIAILEKMPTSVLGWPNPMCASGGAASAPSAHAISLDQSWADYVQSNLHRPKDSRRKRARLAEHGEVRFILASSLADEKQLFPILIEQKTRRYLELNSDGFDRPGYRAYYAAVTEELRGSGVVHLSALEVGGQILATHWGLVWRDRFYSLMLAFAEHPLARYSPGRLLIEHLVEWSFQQRLRVFDLGVGDMDWKQRFAPDRMPLYHQALPANPLGWTYWEAKRMRDALVAQSLGQTPKEAA
jgi:CelD/BcsL family acetyltransferase involved in cellulose biosynthesis